jgi:hypothetical protein
MQLQHEVEKIDSLSDPCQYIYRSLKKATIAEPRWANPIRRVWWALKKHAWYVSILGPSEYLLKVFRAIGLGPGRGKRGGKHRKTGRKKPRLNLKPGDLVEVKSEKEIFETLDVNGQHRGLAFFKEMVKFCGKRFRVYKRLRRIILEASGEMREMKTPTVLLEGVLCDGEFHGNCDRSCFCYWREIWLKPVEPKQAEEHES